MPTLPIHRPAAAALLLSLGVAATAPALAECRSVNGHYTEHVAAEACASMTGVCIQGLYSGVLQGAFSTAVDTFVPNAEVPAVPYAQFTATSTLDVRLAGRAGTLVVRNVGAVRLDASGEIVDLQSIVGGTGGFAGASGTMTAVGTFSFAEGGRSEYGGKVCLPGSF